MSSIAFIGAGRMASAIIAGLIAIQHCEPEQISCVSKTGASALKLANEKGIQHATSITNAIKDKDIVILAFKPKNLLDLPENFDELVKGKLVISVLAATPLNVLNKHMPSAKNIIRIMPNTPAQIGKGVTGYCKLKDMNPKDSEIVGDFLNTLGTSYLMEEDKMEAFTAIAGCGPAYFFEFASTIENTAIELGLSEAISHKVVTEMLLGSALLLEADDRKAEELRDQVAPPGGLTAAALEHMKAKGLRDTIKSAILEAKKKSDQIIHSDHA